MRNSILLQINSTVKFHELNLDENKSDMEQNNMYNIIIELTRFLFLILGKCALMLQPLMLHKVCKLYNTTCQNI